MRWIFIICLTFNGITQGNNIDILFKKISTIQHEKSIMENKIKQLEEDVWNLERRKKWKQKVQKLTVLSKLLVDWLNDGIISSRDRFIRNIW